MAKKAMDTNTPSNVETSHPDILDMGSTGAVPTGGTGSDVALGPTAPPTTAGVPALWIDTS